MRRSFVLIGLALLLSASIAQAQTPSAPAAAAQPQADMFRFSTDSAAVIMQVDPAKVSEFTGAMQKVFEALASSEKPEVKAYGAGMKLLRLDVPANDQPITFLLFIDAVKKDLSYDLVRMIYFSGRPSTGPDEKLEMIFPTRETTDELVKVLGASLKNRIPWPLAKIG